MPVASSTAGSKYHTKGYTIASTTTGADATLVYTAPAFYHGTVRFLTCSNSNAATKTISVQFYHNEDSSYHYIAKATSVASGAVLDLLNGGYLFLHPGDKIVAYSNLANAFDAMISVEEVYSSVVFSA